MAIIKLLKITITTVRYLEFEKKIQALIEFKVVYASNFVTIV